VRHVAVLRPGAVGDFVFALPALAALREAYPQAAITLLGRAWQAEFLAGRGTVDAVRVLPVVRGVGAQQCRRRDPAVAAVLENARQTARFLADLNASYGGGR
jgi:ADP-heptose:LPS heptosyltransferase